jgi:hypothetical protein
MNGGRRNKIKRKTFFLIAIFLLLAQGSWIKGQFTPAEVSERAQWEEFLKTAEITSSKEIKEGVTKPYRLYLKKGDVERSAAWKNPHGIQKGYLEGWQYEIAAYRMDKLLELNMIPPTVEREFNEKKGSLQFWVTKEMNDLERLEKKIDIPKDAFDRWEKMKYVARAFDSLIGNEDRTQQNTLYTKDWRTILIDHSRAFRSSEKFTKQLMFGQNGITGNKPFRKLPRTFVEKIKTLTFDSIKNAVGPYLEDKEIKAILIRKDLFLKEIDEMIKEKGEDKVLY